MIIVSTFTSFGIGTTCHIFFSNLFIERANSDIDYSLNTIRNSFMQQINKLHKDISFIAIEPTIIRIAQDIKYNNQSDFAYNYEDAQQIFNSFIVNNHLVKNIAILGKNGEFYSTVEVGLKFQNTNMNIWSEEKLRDIHWLSARKNPFDTLSNDVLPIIFPIGLNNYGYLSFLPEKGEILMNIVVLVDVVKLNTYFDEINKSTQSKMILFDDKSNPLSITKKDSLFNVAANDSIRDQLQKADNMIRFEEIINDSKYIITSKNVAINNLKIVSIISQKELLSNIDIIERFTLIVSLISLVITVAISLMVSKTITTPLNKLMTLVKKTEKGDYSPHIMTNYKDELGVLNSALNNMSMVIQKQFETIKKEQELKTKAEIDILTRQINPHFLYNTLDCIRWEVLNGNLEGSSNMIESLGNFLRLGLNGSINTLTIEQEISHVEEYVNIMNNRLNSNIKFISIVEENIKHYKILKLILQPIVENCIKHGLDDETLNILSTPPTINIHAYIHNDTICIDVVDNGKGIDIPKAKASLYQNKSQKDHHIGLHNVYSRLRTFYGNLFDMSFSSIPYYSNIVKIIIPYYH